MKCNECGKETKNNKFCTRSYANRYNNRKSPKRKLVVKYCNRCGNKIDRRTYKNQKRLCKFCSFEHRREELKLTTIKEMQNRNSTKGKHLSWINANIRNLNRSWNKSLVDLPCAICGYDKHVELAHIKSISSFSLESTIGEVNAKENVIQLCPNCHWEFDNGLVNL